jgi:hypothetical protein
VRIDKPIEKSKLESILIVKAYNSTALFRTKTQVLSGFFEIGRYTVLAMTQVVRTFPSAKIPSKSGDLPVEVSLIAQLGHGSGNHLYESVLARQKAHQDFIDELDEPSAKLAGTDFEKGDATSLYTFSVGAKGHPFHRHAGHRIFTAVSGSGGAQLRFSSVTLEQIEQDPNNFVKALNFINIPPDCMFTVRFGGDTWHQFYPLLENSPHPVFFALSCHTNELGGNLPETLRQQVINNEANIPSLTQLLPKNVADILERNDFDTSKIPTTSLSLDAPAGSALSAACLSYRGGMGTLRGAWSKWRGSTGFASNNGNGLAVVELESTPKDLLLINQFNDEKFHHEDTFRLTLDDIPVGNRSASGLLASLLAGFLENRPTGVSRMMAFRNVLVKPIGLRTSPLGCPVSSLLSKQREHLFANRFPVLDQQTNTDNTFSQVVLGADDKHLKFRSCVGVKIINPHRVEFTLGTRVQCTNLFGRFYMAVIDRVHRGYITPTMLRMAVEHATQTAENSMLVDTIALKIV